LAVRKKRTATTTSSRRDIAAVTTATAMMSFQPAVVGWFIIQSPVPHVWCRQPDICSDDDDEVPTAS
jgi:hypothetical protein